MCDALKELMRPEMEEELNKAVDKARKDENKKARQDERYDIFSTMIKNGTPISELYRSFGKEQVDQALGVTL